MSKTNYDDAIKQSIDYFNGDELAASVYINKYAINIDGDFNVYINNKLVLLDNLIIKSIQK